MPAGWLIAIALTSGGMMAGEATAPTAAPMPTDAAGVAEHFADAAAACAGRDHAAVRPEGVTKDGWKVGSVAHRMFATHINPDNAFGLTTPKYQDRRLCWVSVSGSSTIHQLPAGLTHAMLRKAVTQRLQIEPKTREKAERVYGGGRRMVTTSLYARGSFRAELRQTGRGPEFYAGFDVLRPARREEGEAK